MHLENTKIIIADTFFKRLVGLIGKKNFDYGMYFINCNAIHTFFMKETIRIIALNQYNTVLDIKIIKPWKIYIFKTNKKTNILELPLNISFNYQIGDKLF